MKLVKKYNYEFILPMVNLSYSPSPKEQSDDDVLITLLQPEIITFSVELILIMETISHYIFIKTFI